MKTHQIAQQLVLGSSSIYRRELLQRLQIPFAICSPDVEETPLAGERPDDAAVRLAVAKSRAVANTHPGALIIGADQVAVLEGIQLGKPLNRANATRQLQLVRGKEVVFYTALSLLNSRTNGIQTRLVPSHVKFRQYVAREIIKAEHIVDYTTREGFAERFARRFGAVAAETLISAGLGWGLR